MLTWVSSRVCQIIGSLIVCSGHQVMCSDFLISRKCLSQCVFDSFNISCNCLPHTYYVILLIRAFDRPISIGTISIMFETFPRSCFIDLNIHYIKILMNKLLSIYKLA